MSRKRSLNGAGSAGEGVLAIVCLERNRSVERRQKIPKKEFPDKFPDNFPVIGKNREIIREIGAPGFPCQRAGFH
jgi:hypothetical protein